MCARLKEAEAISTRNGEAARPNALNALAAPDGPRMLNDIS